MSDVEFDQEAGAAVSMLLDSRLHDTRYANPIEWPVGCCQRFDRPLPARILDTRALLHWSCTARIRRLSTARQINWYNATECHGDCVCSCIKVQNSKSVDQPIAGAAFGRVARVRCTVRLA
jgi:hypothetical protein